MGRQLLILRHGKSDWNYAVSDFDRPLKKRGKQDAKNLGIWLLQQNQIPDYIVCSPAKRARKTAEKLSNQIGFSAQLIEYDQQIYAAELEDLLSVLANCPTDTERIMLVGHNPGLEELLEYLHKGILEIPVDGKLLPTATLALLTISDSWDSLSSNCAELLSIIRPSSLI